MNKLLLTADETGQLLGISKWKVFDLVRRRELDSVKIGGLRRIPKVAIERFIEELGRQSGAA